MRTFITILLIFFSFGGLHTSAQNIERFNSFSYNVNEGLLQSTIADVAFDNNNFCWLSFPNGVQKFDGKNFIAVEVQPGLPDDNSVIFFRCRNGDLLISHSQGISKYIIGSNRFVRLFTISPGKKNLITFIGEDEGSIYFYTTPGSVIGMDAHTYKIVSKAEVPELMQPAGFEYTMRLSDNIINHKVALNINYKLYLWDLKQHKLLKNADTLPYMSYYFLHLKSEDEVLYYSYKMNNALQLYNFITHKKSSLFIKGKDNKPIARCSIVAWRDKTLVSFSNKIYEIDTVTWSLKCELVNYQNQPIAGTGSIAHIAQDNFGNLLLATVSNGIKKIIRNNYPVRYYGTENSVNNFIISVLPDKATNRILAGTAGNGLLIFDTLQHLIKHIKTWPGLKLPVAVNTILKTSRGDYLLFNGADKNVWLLSSNLSTVTPIPISSSLPSNKSGISYFGKLLYQNDREALMQSQSRLYKIDLAQSTVTEHEFTTAYTMSGLLYNNNVVISHASDELIFLDAYTFKELKKVPLKNTGGVRCFVKDDTNNIYAGSNKGIFKLDSTGKVLMHLSKKTGLPDECIYAMCFDNKGLLWCSSNKGIFKINNDNSILQLKKEDGLQENEFNTNVVAKTNDDEIFFGGVNGISSFYPSAINSFEEKIKLLITKIKINNEEAFTDTAVWQITDIDLPFHQNSLSFDFTAMAGSNPNQYVYQYKMDGVDKQWLQNDGLQTVRYLLPAGTYVFKMYASRFFNKEAKPMKEIRIIIHSPFYKTWWFITGIILLFASLLVVGINRYNKIKYDRWLSEMESEHKMQEERERISRDLHDNIGAYANAVLYNTELLQNEKNINERNELMKDVKFASRDIITALRETVWALKKNEFTAQDCLLRIRNFIQPLAKYYQQVNFKIEGDAPAVSLHSTKALNLVRIVQEAVSNSLKHSEASNITINSTMKNSRWKLIVADDGIGFDYEGINELQPGNGLNNMKHRAGESGFALAITSQLRKETKIIIEVSI